MTDPRRKTPESKFHHEYTGFKMLWRGLLLLLIAAAVGVAGFQAADWRQQKISGLEQMEIPDSVRRPARQPADVLLFGDSRIAQWTALPERDYVIARIGFPGETAIRLAAQAK